MTDFDICIVGSGAGASPVAYSLANAGYKVVVLEKGPWFKTEDFSKDEMAFSRRSVYTPNLKDERHGNYWINTAIAFAMCWSMSSRIPTPYNTRG